MLIDTSGFLCVFHKDEPDHVEAVELYQRTDFHLTQGWVADRLRRTGRGGRMFFSSFAALCAIPCWFALLFSDNTVLLLASNFVLLALSLIWLGPAAADVHEIAGPQLRGLGIGIYFFAVNIAAYAIGAPLIGKLNDVLGADRNPSVMRYALLVCPLACLLSSLLLWLGGRRLQRDSNKTV